MPITPLHPAVAYLLNRWQRNLSLPALIVGAMAPDLEIPVVYFATGGLYNRLVLHSLLGAAVLGTLVAVLLTVFAYSIAVSYVFKLDKEELEEKCHFSTMLVLCCFVGNLSHVLIDSLHHSFNPLLYPFVNESFDAFMLNNAFISPTALVSIPMFTFLILIFILEIRRGKKGFWKRIFIE
jgi:hypothetical protein